MRTKKELVILKRKLLFSQGGKSSFYNDDNDNFKIAYHDIRGNHLGEIEYYKLKNEDFYVMEFVESKVKGLGSLLMYDIMNKIYPSWLCIDRETVTIQGVKFWECFKNVPYVEQGMLPKHLHVDNNVWFEPTYGINNTYRFTKKK